MRPIATFAFATLGLAAFAAAQPPSLPPGVDTTQAYTTRKDDLPPVEHPKATRVSVAPYAAGVGVGALYSASPDLRDKQQQFFKLSFIQSIEIPGNLVGGLDLDWLAPGSNFGGTAFLDAPLGGEAVRPFLGAGVGMQYFERAYGNGFGAAATAHAGVLIDLADELQLRVRVPYEVTLNRMVDQTVGIDLGLLFSSPLRTTHVKKLKYE